MFCAKALAARLVVLGCAAAAIGCSDEATSTSTAADTSSGANDTAAAFDSASTKDAAADTGADTAAADAQGDSSADASVDAAADSGADAAVDAKADAEADVAVDAVADTGADVAADAVADTGADVAADAVADTGPDIAADVAADVAPDVAADVAADTGPAQCTAGALKRCWVECPEAYPSGCINAGLPVMIMGTQACADGQWQPCVTNAVCGDYKGTCTNSTKAPTTVLCTDGVSKKVGGYLCLKPIGAQCNVSYYNSWPMADCPDLCSGPDDVCTTAGEKRECTATCGSPSGPAVKGTQNCNDYCSGKFWGPCLSDDACLKMSK